MRRPPPSREIADPEANMELVKLEKAPKIAVYAPDEFQPWDDAVALVMTYAEIPYERIYDREVLAGMLPQYDWLHLHHEDFTGQYGKFYRQFRNAPWYLEQVRNTEAMAKELGYAKVSQMKGAVAAKIRDYVAGGGYLFTMCSGTDSYDIALAAEGVDICDSPFDGDPPDPRPSRNSTSTVRSHSRTSRSSPTPWSMSSATSMPPASTTPSGKPAIFSPCSISVPSGTWCPPCSARTMNK
jgi:hypothetical protein